MKSAVVMSNYFQAEFKTLETIFSSAARKIKIKSTQYFIFFNLGKTHIKKFFFSGRTAKGVGRVNPLTTKQKKLFFSKIRLF